MHTNEVKHISGQDGDKIGAKKKITNKEYLKEGIYRFENFDQIKDFINQMEEKPVADNHIEKFLKLCKSTKNGKPWFKHYNLSAGNIRRMMVRVANMNWLPNTENEIKEEKKISNNQLNEIIEVVKPLMKSIDI